MRRRIVGGLLLVLTLIGVGTSAWAYWTSSGTGAGSATTATLNPANNVIASYTLGLNTVSVSWTAPTGLPPQGYLVTRTSGSVTTAACGSSAANLVTTTSCTDPLSSPGTYTYTVTAVFNSWTAVSGSSSGIHVTPDVTAPTVDLTTVNGVSPAFPYSTNAINSIGGTCGTAPGDNLAVTVRVSSTVLGTATCTASGSWTLVSNPAISTTGTYGLSAMQDDVSGNAGTSPIRTVNLDTTKPTLTSITRAGSAQAVNAGPLLWTVTFSEPVTGVAAGNFSLTTTGLGGTGIPVISAPTAVSGPPSTIWTVSVGMTNVTGGDAGSVALNLANVGSIKDAAGNTLATAAQSGPAYTYDTTKPSALSIVRAGPSALVNAGPLAWTVTFSEPVSAVATGNFGVTASGLTPVPSVHSVSSATGTTPSATWTVTIPMTGVSGTNAGSIGLNLTGIGSVVDRSGNALGTTTLTGPAYTFDTTPPAVTLTRVNGSVRTFPYYTTSDVSSIGGTCAPASEAISQVTVLVTLNGTVTTSTATCNNTTWSWSPSPSWSTTATRTISATQADGAGNVGTATQTVGVDKTPPTVLGVSSPLANGSYKAGQVVPVTVTFSEPVWVTGTPRIALALPASTNVNYSAGSGSDTLTFTYTVAAGNTSADLDYAATGSLTGGTIRDVVNQNANRTLSSPGSAGSLGANKNIVIDTTSPAVAAPGVSSGLPNGSYTVGQVVPVTVTFSEPVTVTGSPLLTLVTGTPASYSSGSGTATLTFGFTVAAGNTSADLDYAATTSLTLNGGTINDAAGNAATLTLAVPGAANSLGANKNIAIDTTAPAVAAPGVTSGLANGTYKAGQVVPVTVTFSEPVTVSGTPQLSLATGSPAATAVGYSSGSGTSTLTFTYTVAAGNTSADLDYAGSTALALNGGSIADAAGNPATLTLAAPGAAGSLGANKALVIDTTVPAVTVTRVNTAYPTFPYRTNATVSVIGGACGTAIGDTSTVYPLLNGAATAPASAPCSSGSWTLTFTTPLSVDGTWTLSATQSDAATNTGTAVSRGLTIDKTRPTVSSIARAGASVAVNAGPLQWTVTFSEPVSGVATSNFDFVTSGTSGNPTITGVAPSGAAPTATWIVSTSQAGMAGTNSGSIGLNLIGAGSVVDAVGNTLSTTSFTGQTYGFDTTSATVSAVTSTLADGSYREGQEVPVTVTFTEPVTVSGTPQLTLATGSPATKAVDYSSGSTTNTLTFLYTVAAGHTSGDLDYATGGALTLNGGSILDAAGNAATRTLAAPGATGSLGASKALVIDTTAPLVTVTGIPNFLSVYWWVTGAGEVGGGSVTVYLCRNSGPPCTASNAVRTFTPTVESDGTWTSGGYLGSGTFHASATQTDAAGNVGSSQTYGPP